MNRQAQCWGPRLTLAVVAVADELLVTGGAAGDLSLTEWPRVAAQSVKCTVLIELEAGHLTEAERERTNDRHMHRKAGVGWVASLGWRPRPMQLGDSASLLCVAEGIGVQKSLWEDWR